VTRATWELSIAWRACGVVEVEVEVEVEDKSGA
jgi:hypothetical protein